MALKVTAVERKIKFTKDENDPGYHLHPDAGLEGRAGQHRHPDVTQISQISQILAS